MITLSMQRRLWSTAFLVLALLITPPPPLAQSTDSPTTQAESEATANGSADKAPAAPAGKRYLIEVIVFNYHGPISAGNEIWHRTPPIEFPTAATEAVLQAPRGSIQFTDIKYLAPHLSRLRANPQYEVATYTAWTQPLFGKSESIAVDLVPPSTAGSTRGFSTFSRPAVQGSLQLFENRLLFVDLDISNEIEQDPADPYGPRSTQTKMPEGTFRLQEKRRVKLNEVHYFDHPYLGALVRVSRWPPNPG